MPFLGLTVLQLLLAFVSAIILHRIVLRRFFLRWLSSFKFTCWLAPTNKELTALVRGSSSTTASGGGDNSKKGRQRNRGAAKGLPSPSKDENVVFKISTSNLDSIRLEASTMNFEDFDMLHNSYDLEWMVDLAITSIFSFLLTELAFYSSYKTNVTNLSQLWLMIVIAYSVLNLWRLTRAYFTNQQSTGERSICIVSFCIFMLIAMIVLITDERKLEFGLEIAYKSFNETATAFIENHTLTVSDPTATRKPVSFIIIKFGLAIICALTGMVFTFPAFRFAQLHKELYEDPGSSELVKYTTIFNFVSPVMVTLLWVKPISRDFIAHWSMTDTTFDSLRIYFIIVVDVIRFFSLPLYVGAFLKTVHLRLRRLRRRGGTTTNKEVQMTVSSIYNYVNVVGLQFILPVLMCISTILLFKSLAGHTWLTFSTEATTHKSLMTPSLLRTNRILTTSSTTPTTTTQIPVTENMDFESDNTSFYNATEGPKVITLDEIKGIFTRDVFQGVMGFATWWLHFSWFLTSLGGMVYHTYFME